MDNIKDDFFVKTSQNTAQTLEELLQPTEKILWKARPKKFAYMMSKSIAMMPVALIWLVLDLTVLIFIFSAPNLPAFLPVFLVGFFALHLTPVWIWLGQIIKASKEMNSIEYAITNKRVLEVRGKTRYIHASIKLAEIEDAVLSKNFIDKMLKVRDIYISGKENKIVLVDSVGRNPVGCRRDRYLQYYQPWRKFEFYANESAA